MKTLNLANSIEITQNGIFLHEENLTWGDWMEDGTGKSRTAVLSLRGHENRPEFAPASVWQFAAKTHRWLYLPGGATVIVQENNIWLQAMRGNVKGDRVDSPCLCNIDPGRTFLFRATMLPCTLLLFHPGGFFLNEEVKVK